MRRYTMKERHRRFWFSPHEVEEVCALCDTILQETDNRYCWSCQIYVNDYESRDDDWPIERTSEPEFHDYPPYEYRRPFDPIDEIYW